MKTIPLAILLAMTWEEVNISIVALFGVLTAITGGLILLSPKIVELIKKFGEVQAAVRALQETQSKHSDQITANSQDITKVALATPVNTLDALKAKAVELSTPPIPTKE